MLTNIKINISYYIGSTSQLRSIKISSLYAQMIDILFHQWDRSASIHEEIHARFVFLSCYLQQGVLDQCNHNQFLPQDDNVGTWTYTLLIHCQKCVTTLVASFWKDHECYPIREWIIEGMHSWYRTLTPTWSTVLHHHCCCVFSFLFPLYLLRWGNCK